MTVFLNRTGAFDRHDFAIGPTPTSLVTLADLRKRGILDLLVDNNGTTLPIFVGQP